MSRFQLNFTPDGPARLVSVGLCGCLRSHFSGFRIALARSVHIHFCHGCRGWKALSVCGFLKYSGMDARLSFIYNCTISYNVVLFAYFFQFRHTESPELSQLVAGEFPVFLRQHLRGLWCNSIWDFMNVRLSIVLSQGSCLAA